MIQTRACGVYIPVVDVTYVLGGLCCVGSLFAEQMEDFGCKECEVAVLNKLT